MILLGYSAAGPNCSPRAPPPTAPTLHLTLERGGYGDPPRKHAE